MLRKDGVIFSETSEFLARDIELFEAFFPLISSWAKQSRIAKGVLNKTDLLIESIEYTNALEYLRKNYYVLYLIKIGDFTTLRIIFTDALNEKALAFLASMQNEKSPPPPQIQQTVKPTTNSANSSSNQTVTPSIVSESLLTPMELYTSYNEVLKYEKYKHTVAKYTLYEDAIDARIKQLDKTISAIKMDESLTETEKSTFLTQAEKLKASLIEQQKDLNEQKSKLTPNDQKAAENYLKAGEKLFESSDEIITLLENNKHLGQPILDAIEEDKQITDKLQNDLMAEQESYDTKYNEIKSNYDNIENVVKNDAIKRLDTIILSIENSNKQNLDEEQKENLKELVLLLKEDQLDLNGQVGYENVVASLAKCNNDLSNASNITSILDYKTRMNIEKEVLQLHDMTVIKQQNNDKNEPIQSQTQKYKSQLQSSKLNGGNLLDSKNLEDFSDFLVRLSAKVSKLDIDTNPQYLKLNDLLTQAMNFDTDAVPYSVLNDLNKNLEEIDTLSEFSAEFKNILNPNSDNTNTPFS